MIHSISELLRGFYDFVIALFKSSGLIFKLTRQDFKACYLGSYLTIIWAFVNPCITILIFYFVFQVAFGSGPVNNYPFVLWLCAGMIPWFFFSESLANATGSIVDYSYIVKKIVFRVSMLPLIKIFSSLVVHLFFVLLIIVLMILYGYKPALSWIQVFYYMGATMLFVMGLSWVTSSIAVFIRDVRQIIAMLLQIGFWITPIFWNFSRVPQKYVLLCKANPAYYIVEGYRECFLTHVWFWEHPLRMLYFWGVTFVIIIIGALLFLRLRPHFADVL